MSVILHIDSSAKLGMSGTDAHGSHTRRLSDRFVKAWKNYDPDAKIVYRDVGQYPPKPVSAAWIHAAFTKPEVRSQEMIATLAESDELVDELLAADVIVCGVPMYNFSYPAQFKAYIDNIVRVGRTFGFDRNRKGEPYWPLLSEHHKRLVVLSSRGDYGYDGRLIDKNHLERSIFTAFSYLGITNNHQIAIEYDEFGDDRLMLSIAKAEQEVDMLVQHMSVKENRY